MFLSPTISNKKNISFKINNFDLIRLLAATQVIVFHTVSHLHLTWFPGQWILGHFSGVPIFFIISGYLISASLERSDTVTNYLRNRILRIYPGLWTCIILTVMIAALFGFIPDSVHALKWFIIQLFAGIYTPDYLRGFGTGSYNIALWTIPIELGFYIALIPLYFLISKYTKHHNFMVFFSFVAFLAISIFIRHHFPDFDDAHPSRITNLLKHSPIPMFYIFLLGVTLHRINLHEFKCIHGKGAYWISIYILYVFIARYGNLPLPKYHDFFEYIFMSFVIISLAYTKPDFSAKLLRKNDFSYGIYIYHGLILNILITLHLTGSYKYFFVVLFGAYIAGALSWRLIERKCLRHKKQALRTI